MLEQPIDSIDEATLWRLVDNQVGERRGLEFKRDLPGGKDADIKEFLADVTSFANAQGGDLIFGIKEEDGAAADLPGVEGDPDTELLRIEERLQAGIDPRLIGVRTHWERPGRDRLASAGKSQRATPRRLQEQRTLLEPQQPREI
ncbi:ATP-binding protein [Sphingomonas sp. HH69]